MSEYEEVLELVRKSGIPLDRLKAFFRTKCKDCGHQRIAHDEHGKCDGVMNKPCSSGCDEFVPE